MAEGDQILTEQKRSIVVPAQITIVNNTKTPTKSKEYEPPDGGFYAFVVMISSFICNGIIFGIINNYSPIFLKLQEKLVAAKDEEATSKAALVGSLAIGSTFLCSMISGILTDRVGVRFTTFFGGVFIVSGLFISSFITESVSLLYLTYGILFGIGAALAYTPCLAILGHYFKKYLGQVSGFVTAGSSVFTIFMPILIEKSIQKYSLEITLRLLAGLGLFIIVCSFIYRPLIPKTKRTRKSGTSKVVHNIKTMINFDIWHNKKYVLWVLSNAIALCGYFVPYVHTGKFVQENFPGEDEKLPIMCIGITSGIGRLLCGMLADRNYISRITMQQMAFICMGLMTMVMPLVSSYYMLLAVTLIMGLFDGCFIAMISPIAFDLCGANGATQAIGFLLAGCSIPLTVGPAIAGKMYDLLGSYKMAYILSGIPPIVGSIFLFLRKCIKDSAIVDRTELPLSKTAWIEGDENLLKIADKGISDGIPFVTHFICTLSLTTGCTICSLERRKYTYSIL